MKKTDLKNIDKKTLKKAAFALVVVLIVVASFFTNKDEKNTTKKDVAYDINISDYYKCDDPGARGNTLYCGEKVCIEGRLIENDIYCKKEQR